MKISCRKWLVNKWWEYLMVFAIEKTRFAVFFWISFHFILFHAHIFFIFFCNTQIRNFKIDFKTNKHEIYYTPNWFEEWIDALSKIFLLRFTLAFPLQNRILNKYSHGQKRMYTCTFQIVKALYHICYFD